MKINWGNLGIVLALVVLAASIFFAALRISQTAISSVERAKRSMEKTQKEFTQEARKLTQELRRKMGRDTIALTYAFRKASVENRVITTEDFEKGYQFVDSLLVPTLSKVWSD
jgi:hypothetical protein